MFSDVWPIHFLIFACCSRSWILMINIMNTNDDWPSVILCCDDDWPSVILCCDDVVWFPRPHASTWAWPPSMEWSPLWAAFLADGPPFHIGYCVPKVLAFLSPFLFRFVVDINSKMFGLLGPGIALCYHRENAKNPCVAADWSSWFLRIPSWLTWIYVSFRCHLY